MQRGSRKFPFVLTAGLVIAFAPGANAQPPPVYFPQDAVIDTSLGVSNALIGRSAQGANSNPTVTLAEGGSLWQYETFNSSRLNIVAGWSGEGLARGDSRILMTGGSSGNLRTYDRSAFEVTGTSAISSLNLFDQSTARIDGNSRFFGIFARDNSQLTMVNGRSNIGVYAWNNSTLRFQGGSSTFLTVGGNSTTIVSGGSPGDITAIQNSQVTVTGGDIDQRIYATGSANVRVDGGNFLPISLPDYPFQFNAFENSTIDLFGYGLALHDPTPVVDDGIFYTLSGFLLDGTSVDGLQGYVYGNAMLRLNNVVPEPGAVLVCLAGAFAGTACLRHRRKQKLIDLSPWQDRPHPLAACAC